MNTVLSSLSQLKAHSLESFTHTVRVGHYASQISVRANLSRQFVLASFLHDIGKLRIPLSILEKVGPLTDEEFRIIRTHAYIGYEIANSLNLSAIVAEYILHHHNYYCSTHKSSYPMGQSQPFLLEGGLISILDVFDAMTSHRCYHQACSRDVVIAYIKANDGIQFAPPAVSLFLNHINLLSAEPCDLQDFITTELIPLL